VPFDFLRRRKDQDGRATEGESPQSPLDRGAGDGRVTFDGLTEEWRLTGVMNVEGRLSDALNRREAIAISEVRWQPIDGSSPLTPASGLRTIDPYDLIAVLAGPDTQPSATDAKKAARRVRKAPYEVVIEAPPFRIVGTVHVFPGTDPRQVVEQGAEMFIALTNASAFVADQRVAEGRTNVILVNRLYVRGIEATGR
jgi:hypothetical protein